MPNIEGHIRRSQLVTTFGVGAVLPVGDQSFMVAGLERWNVGPPDLHEPRLERELSWGPVQCHGFVQPPTSDGKADVPVVRFPMWQSCPMCHRLDRHTNLTQHDLHVCSECQVPLVPSRFVIACEKGHVDDFPYERWVHRGGPQGSGSHHLKLQTSGKTASLAGISVECSCGATRTMEDAFDRTSLQTVSTCLGRRPYIAWEGEGCDQVPRTLQRGASSVWFGRTRSALSIPPWSESAARALDGHWNTLRFIPTDSLEPILRDMRLDEKTGYSLKDLIAIAVSRRKLDSGEAVGDLGLRRQEHEALVRGRPQSAVDTDFATREGEVPDSLAPWVSQLQLVTRLREVRALEGFSRVNPPRGTTNVVPLRSEEIDWLPGIEVKGEGLFVRLAEEKLATWRKRADVIERVGRISAQDVKRHETWGIAPEREITPDFLLTHVLAHALINQMALDAGYPAGSLRERLYYDDEAQGLLVYTATTDSAGSLGGLISQGEHSRFEGLFTEAIRRFAWCSADPVCIESEASGAESLNLAACHSCALLPETSCEEMNGFLDRGLLVGTPDQPELGFFRDLL